MYMYIQANLFQNVVLLTHTHTHVIHTRNTHTCPPFQSKREFQQTRTSLVKKGYIERVTLEVAPAEGDDSDDGSTKVVAYRLLRPYESESKPEVGGEEVGGDVEAEEEGEEEIGELLLSVPPWRILACFE